MAKSKKRKKTSKKVPLKENKYVKKVLENKAFAAAIVIVFVFAVFGFRLNSYTNYGITRSQEMFGQIQAENEELKLKLEEMEKFNKDLRDRVDLIMADIPQLKNDLDDLSYETESLANQRNRCDDLENDKDDLEQDIKDLEDDIAELEDEIAELEADDEDTSDEEDELADLEDELNDLEADLKDVEDEIDDDC